MKHNKLVRDRIPEIIAASGQTAVCQTLTDADFDTALRHKLREEVDEFLASGDVVELADVLEVVYALAQTKGLAAVDLEAMRRRKEDERGGFDERVWLVEVV